MAFSPKDYAKSAVLASEVGQEMVQRLEWMTLQPNVVLDVGCGTGELSVLLAKRFPNALVIGLDNVENRVEFAKNEQATACFWVCGDGGRLPFADYSVDLIYANMMLPWHNDSKQLLQEWRRVLHPEGLLMFSALGTLTMQECAKVIASSHPALWDMHDLGDKLVQTGFAEPVLDTDCYTLTYRQKETLFQELLASEMSLDEAILAKKEAIASLSPNEEGLWPVTFEVIFAHTFAPSPVKSNSAEGVTKVPLSHLRKQLRG